MIIVAPVSSSAADQAALRQGRLTKPTGALGRLEDASVWLSSVQGSCPPEPFSQPQLVIFAGDHGIARQAATSAYPPEVTAQMVANFVTGGAAANVLARQFGARVRVVDVSVDAPHDYLDAVDAHVAARRIRRGSGSIDREDAMTSGEAQAALALGSTLADEAIASGADVLIPGDMGIGNTAVASTITGLLTGRAAVDVTGRGTGIDDAVMQRKVVAIDAAMERGRASVGAPEVLLATVGSPDIAAMSGFLARAAERGVPVILDGIVSCSAALVAERMAPGARQWWAAGHVSTEPAARIALDSLGLTPLLDLDLRLGEGTGALLALPMLAAAATTLGQMATFDSAGVSDRGH